MSYAILRVEKCKDFGAVKAMADEHLRQRPVPNADPTRAGENRILTGGDNPTDDLRQYINDSGAKIHQGKRASVLALDVFIGASPDFFRSASLADREKWVEQSQAWLVQHFGRENVVSSVLHLDETTPHIQAIVCPMDDAPGSKGKAKMRLNAAKWVDGKTKMAALQDSYAAAVADLGLARGVRGSQAEHTTIQHYYGQLQSTLDAAKPTRLAAPQLPEPPGALATPAARREYHGDAQARVNQVVRTANDAVAQATETAAAAELRASRAEARAEAMARTAAAAQAETAVLRDIPLHLVAEALGMEPTPDKGRGMWGPIAITGSKWYDHRAGVGGGGAVDLVKHMRQGDFADAKAWLRDTFGAEQAAAATAAQAVQAARAEVEVAQRTSYAPPQADPDGIQAVRKWLYRRGIAPEVFDSYIRQGAIYAARSGAHINAVFTRPKGGSAAEICGTGSDSFKGLSPRSEPTRAVIFHVRVGRRGDQPKIVLVESAVKALAYAQLHPNGDAAVVSTAGARPRLPWLMDQIKRGRQIVVAYDNDAAGDEAAETLARTYGDAVSRQRPGPSDTKDWDDMLPKPRLGATTDDSETLEQQNERWRREWAEIEARTKREAEERDWYNQASASYQDAEEDEESPASRPSGPRPGM